MKNLKNSVKAILLVLLFVITASTLLAQEPAKAPRQKGHNAELMPPPPPPPPDAPQPTAVNEKHDRNMPPRLDLPGLTDDQKEKLRTAGMEHMKSMTPLRNQVREKKARLNTLLSMTPFDVKAADLVADDLGKLESTMLKETIRHHQAIRGLLTPDQLVIFDARPKPFLKR